MKILIVDDKQENRVMLRYMVKKFDPVIVEASHGEEACRLCKEQGDIDLVLMDVMMPVMDGMAATAIIKAHAQQRHVAVIFVTALDDHEMLERCLKCGGDDFIPKPINSLVLSAKLLAHQRVIDLHRQLEKQNEQLHRHQAQIHQDHEVVDRIFQQAMQRNALQLPGFHYYLSPLSMFNGDILLVSSHPTRGTYLLVGDFTGHGLSAAMGTLPMSEIFFTMTRKGLPIGDIAHEMDKHLKEILPVSMFCCAVLLNLDNTRQHLNAWIGGMDSFFVVGKDGIMRREMTSNHMPLGVQWCDTFDASVLQMELQEGDRILCYTDGVTEATNAEGTMLGIERLRTLVVETLQSPQIETHVETIVQQIQAFRGTAEQRDDITIAELICNPQQIAATQSFLSHSMSAAELQDAKISGKHIH